MALSTESRRIGRVTVHVLRRRIGDTFVPIADTDCRMAFAGDLRKRYGRRPTVRISRQAVRYNGGISLDERYEIFRPARGVSDRVRSSSS